MLEGLYSEIKEYSKEAVYQEGERIYLPGDPSDTLYLIIEGRVRLSYLNHDGRSLTLTVLGAGELFGELALAGLERREAMAEVLERASLWAIDKRQFLKLLQEKAELSLQIIQLIVHRLRQLEKKLEELIRHDPTAKLSLTLLQLLEWEDGSDGGEPGRWGDLNFELELTEEDLRELIRVAMAKGAIATPPLQFRARSPASPHLRTSKQDSGQGQG